MKIDRDNDFYPIWEDGHKKGKIEGLRRAIIALEESNYDANKFINVIQKEMDELIRSEFK